jgi:hypothetical protein
MIIMIYIIINNGRDQIAGETMQPKDEKPMNYLLRNIPKDLWDRAKHRAIDDGDSLRSLILKAIQKYLQTEKRRKE